MADELSPEHEAYFRAIFEDFDADGSNQISKDEFRILTGALGQSLSDAKIDELLNEIDQDGNGTVDVDEFLHFMHILMKKADPCTEFAKVFKIFDRDGNGTISAGELDQVMRNLEKPLTASELQEIFKEVKSSSGKEEIDQEQFVRLLMQRQEVQSQQ